MLFFVRFFCAGRPWINMQEKLRYTAKINRAGDQGSALNALLWSKHSLHWQHHETQSISSMLHIALLFCFGIQLAIQKEKSMEVHDRLRHRVSFFSDLFSFFRCSRGFHQFHFRSFPEIKFLRTSLCLFPHVGMQEPVSKKKISLLRGGPL